MIDFNKIVHKLGKMKGEFIDIDDIADIVDPDFRKKAVQGKSPTYKTLYRLKGSDIIIPIKQGLYYVREHEDTNIEEVIEDRYWRVVKKILAREVGGEYFISGNKALEILMKDYSAPKKLLITGKENTKNLQISSTYSLSIRPITSGKKTLSKNIYPSLKNYTEVREIDDQKLRIACPELALLDTLLLRDSESGIDQYLVEKFLKRSSKILRRDILGKLVSMKYITAINRLRSIAKDTNNAPMYDICIDIIKREGGGCFVTSG
ncbi:MAG: hypothetical protein PHH70_01585 [Candidatus Gracilibacteria bacterium]|nr:hypothetical protein [Candidatus Gracilibacteria bacterium]